MLGIDASQYGWGSREWMLIHTIPHIPVEHKDATLISLVKFLIQGQNYTSREVLDLITQGLLTKQYIYTEYPEQATTAIVSEGTVQTPSDDGLHPESDNPANPLTEITQREIQEFLADMDEKLGDGIDPFTTKPKSWDFLDE